LKHIDLVGEKIEQDAREVKTKRSKTFTTCFFPVGDDIRRIVVDWVNFLQKEKLWGNDDPQFPATEVIHGPAAVRGYWPKQERDRTTNRRIGVTASNIIAAMPLSILDFYAAR
jgi:hypothetical protein